ncbi:S8 family serine peptidase [Candidatus Woesearchaeota archaeon]|nr:S8 family serine peptidase [Candidatus Woesearchaeota archaeon]
MDTGVEYFHTELSHSFGRVKGYDVIEDSDNPADRNGHGTHVAGTCAGLNYGVAIGSNLYAVRVLDENGSGIESNLIAGVEWCIKNGMHIVNMSLGSPVASSAFEEICYAAAEKGVILVAAAGNNGGEFAMYPAAFGDPVIAVAAVDRYNRHADFSNIFMTNDISAPGVEIPSSYIGGSYASLSGTSMASPHVAGSIALALPLVRNQDIYGLLDSTAENIGNDGDVFGAGLVRADGMVKELLNGNRFPAALKAIVGALW